MKNQIKDIRCGVNIHHILPIILNLAKYTHGDIKFKFNEVTLYVNHTSDYMNLINEYKEKLNV